MDAEAWEVPRGNLVRVNARSAVLLDLYDTLAWGEWPRLREVMAGRIGVPSRDLQAAFDRTRPARGIGAFAGAEEDLAEVLTACGVEPEPGLVGELLEIEGSFLSAAVHLYDDSMPVLRALRARGLRTAVVSNCSRSTRPVVDRLGLEREVDAVVLSFEVGAAKPDPAIYLAALDLLGAQPAETVFVDDQATYCDGAAALGMRTFLIRRAVDPGEPTRTDGHPVISDLGELLV